MPVSCCFLVTTGANRRSFELHAASVSLGISRDGKFNVASWSLMTVSECYCRAIDSAIVGCEIVHRNLNSTPCPTDCAI